MTDEQRLGLAEEPTPILIDCAHSASWTTCEECTASHGGCGSYPEAKAWGAAWREKALELERERGELEKERDELSAKIGELEKERDEAIKGDTMTLDELIAALQRIRDQGGGEAGKMPILIHDEHCGVEAADKPSVEEWFGKMSVVLR